MMMRNEKRTSSGDIRTTGIVQLEAPTARKKGRLSNEDWSPESFEADADSRDRPEALEQVSLDVDSMVLAEQQHHSKIGELKADGGKVQAQDGYGDCKLSSEHSLSPTTEKKSLRHFSRTKRSRARKDKAAAAAENNEPPSDVSADNVVGTVDLHQLPDDMKYEDDESVDTKGGGDDQDAKQDCSISGRSHLHRIEECLDFLERFGLFREAYWIDTGSDAPVDPGYVGDGTMSSNCKVCGRPEETSPTLVCDACEEAFHVACCNPKIRSIPRDERWYCGNCTRKRKRKSSELKFFSSAFVDEKYPSSWKIDRTKTRGWDLQRMENAHVRIDPVKYQADVPEWTGMIFEKLRGDYPGLELPRSEEEKLKEKLVAEAHLLVGVTPLNWTLATLLPEGEKENWLQCQNVLHEEGDVLPDGTVATKDIICGKWRRAPLHVIPDDGWECSCAVVWDPRHADCQVPQELPAEAIKKRPKARMQPSQEGKNSRSNRAVEQRYLHCG